MIQTFSGFLRVAIKSIAIRKTPAGSLPSLTLREDVQELHRAFFEIKAKYSKQFPVLKQLHFIESGAFPYSPELTEALDQLQMAGAISRENPSYERFSVRPYSDTRSFVEKELKSMVGSDSSKERAFDRLVKDLETALV